jgi:hypothetical protein
MNANQKRFQLEKLIGKMINVIKPKGVSFIKFKLHPLDIYGYKHEFIMDMVYVVPDDSELLKIHPFEYGDPSRYYWNNEISKTIKSYFNVNVIINDSSITSESQYKQSKDI